MTNVLAFGWMEAISIAALIVALASVGLSGIAMFILWPMRNTQGELKRTAETLVDAKIQSAEQKGEARILGEITKLQTHQQGVTNLINQQLQQIEGRLAAGHVHMNTLDERDHALRVEVLQAINELQKVVVTKDDLRALREEFKG